MYLKTGSLAFACMVLLIFAAGAEDISPSLQLDYNGDGIVDKNITDQMLPEGSSALDLLQASTELTTEQMEWGTFVVGIDGTMANWTADQSWWSFEVDGTQAGVSVDKYVLEDGDVVAMSFMGGTPDAVSVFLALDYDGDGEADKAPHLEMAKGSTALDLLNQAANATTEQVEWGTLVVGIDGTVADWEADQTWWLFEVNGQQSAVAVDKYVLNNGDIVGMSLVGAEPEMITVVLELDYEGDGVIDKALHYEIAEGSTALDLLREASSQVTTENADWGTVVVGIDGVMTDWDADQSWWLFEVDGTQSDVSVDKYVLQKGQIVTMSLAGPEEGRQHEAATSG
ncbi:MAG: DUF4430 domain-containing protein [Methanotrichaceae archaeon]|nr:DUF4430 domain-containing protein [Methanotrichaceae archaeon]